ncbi:MAG: heme-copper oxidase subunit III [Candidatus Marinimicrobia bacterium]|nr:heme-copper oxidase subunit III [Candidatus Neomarinimicrobiota bacterium]
MTTQALSKKFKVDEFTSTLGMVIALGCITMLFVTFFVSYSILRIQFGMWSRPGTGLIPITIAIGNTIVLLASSYTYHKSANFSKININKAKKWLGVTLGLGVIFLLAQLILWDVLVNEGFTPKSNIIGSVFFLLTGMHGLHIVAGVGALALVYVKLNKTNSDYEISNLFKQVGLLWHFLDVLWVCLFVAIFII